MTVRQLIDWGAEQFEQHGLSFGHGTDNALDEAASLVLHALGIGYDQPDSILDAIPADDGRVRALKLLQERIRTRKPAAYLLGQARFAGMPFYVDERVLVPRSPIGELIEARFRPWIDPDRVTRILDLCTGSGCIGIACASAFPAARVDATDISGDALEVARINTDRHGLAARVSLHQADLFDGLTGRQYDIIVTNPPYVPQAELAELATEYRHEPAIGLAAGEDGLDIVIRILQQAADYLRPGGILVVEVGYSMAFLEAAFADVPFTWLDFEYGGEGVFLLDHDQLVDYRPVFAAAAARHTAGITQTEGDRQS